MQVISRDDLVTQVRSLANLENSTFITDDEMKVWIENAARRLYNKLILARGQEYYRRENTLTLEPGITAYTLALDFFQLLTVYVADAGRFVPLEPFQMADIARLRNEPSPQLRALRYRLTYSVAEGDQIEFLPTPTVAGEVTYHYLPNLSGTDEDEARAGFNFINGFEAWVVYDVVALCMLKEESDPSFYLSLKAQLERDIDSLAAHRDTTKADGIRDVRGDLGGLAAEESLWRYRP